MHLDKGSSEKPISRNAFEVLSNEEFDEKKNTELQKQFRQPRQANIP